MRQYGLKMNPLKCVFAVCAEYSLTYQPLKFVKGQIVANFIADHSVVEEMLSFFWESTLKTLFQWIQP